MVHLLIFYSQGPTQRKSLGETSNGFEGWPQAVETRRPSTLINSSYMPRLTENVEGTQLINN